MAPALRRPATLASAGSFPVDAAWKLCEIGDVQDCEKTFAVNVHETDLTIGKNSVSGRDVHEWGGP